MRTAPRLAPCLLAVLCLRSVATAEEGLETVRVPVDEGAPPAPVAGPGIWALGDAAVRDSGFPDRSLRDAWEVASDADAGFELFVFAEPPGGAVGDAVVEVLRRTVPGFTEREGFELARRGGAIEARGDAETTARVRELVPALRAALAPRLEVTARLLAEEGSGARLVAAGGASLRPRRWTRLWRQQHDRTFALGYSVEIAQESTAQDPTILGVPEGTEAYVRWTPGETVSVLEVWAGVLDHLEPTSVDLSGGRNVPEGNALGRVELPRTAVRRAFPAVLLPAGSATDHEIAWDGPGGRRVLRLRAEAPTPAPAPVVVGARAVAALRVGAAAAALDAEAREASLDEWATAARAVPDDVSVDTIAEAFLLYEAGPGQVDALRRRIVEAERRLGGATVEVRAVAVGEAALRQALDAGVAVGSVLSPEAEAALLASSAPAGSLRLPVLLGVVAGIRVGESEMVLDDIDVEVAQQAAAVDPVERGTFAGIAGTLRAVARDDGGLDLELDGAFSWRGADATVELAYRPPVGMAFNRDGVRTEDPTVRRVPLPFASRGGAVLQARVALPPAALAAGRPALLAVVSRQGAEALPETVILLGSARR